MGYGLIIGAIASIASSAIGGAMSGGGGGGSPNVNLSGIRLDNPNQAGLGAFNAQQYMWPQLTQFTNQINQTATTGYTDLLKTLYPGATSQLGQISNLASAYLGGNIPADVQAQIQRATAQQAMTGGYAGTGQAANVTARDLGMTSLDLTQLGANMFQTGAGAAKGMIPGYLNPAQLLFSPQQLLQRTDQANYYNTDVANQQQIINANLATQQQAIQAAQQNQGGGTGGGGFGNISSLFGGGSGSGGLGNLFGGNGLGVGGANLPLNSSSGGAFFGNPSQLQVGPMV